MKVLYFDCISGISGDMTVSALLDLGIDKELFLSEIKKLNLECEINIDTTEKNGIKANTFTVIEHRHENGNHHNHIGLSKISKLINESTISNNAKEISIKIFTLLAQAEANVHGVSIEEIHFHEVGAVDSIIDIVGTAILIDILKPQSIICSPLIENTGIVNCSHGIIPVPVPAVTEILRLSNVSLKIINNNLGESITPTGAAIICTLANSFTNSPYMKIDKIGYGAGTKEFEKPNVLRVFLGETDETPSDVIEIETNIDDMSPEILSFTMEELFKNNALDVWFTPIYMKKNRPSYKLSLLCKQEDKEKLISIIFSQTTTAGLRIKPCERIIMQRETITVKTEYGEILVKKLCYNNIVKYIPEYESVKELANKSKIPFQTIYECVNKYSK